MRKNARGLGREKAPSFPDYARPIFPDDLDLVFATPLLSEILAQATASHELSPEYLIVTFLFGGRKDKVNLV